MVLVGHAEQFVAPHAVGVVDSDRAFDPVLAKDRVPDAAQQLDVEPGELAVLVHHENVPGFGGADVDGPGGEDSVERVGIVGQPALGAPWSAPLLHALAGPDRTDFPRQRPRHFAQRVGIPREPLAHWNPVVGSNDQLELEILAVEPVACPRELGRPQPHGTVGR